MIIKDMPKLQSPFVREFNDKHEYVVIDEINPGYEWVFEDPEVIAVEKLDGTNVSIIINENNITDVFNRTARIPFINKGKQFIIEGVQNAYERGYLKFLPNGQHFGEVIGPKLQKNPYKLDKHLFIPFSKLQKEYKYKSWGKYPKDFESISEWFKNLKPLFGRKYNSDYVEGIVFTHPDGRMAKLRRDMFDWYKGKRH